MKAAHAIDDDSYRAAMGRLLALYTQVDGIIMEACAARIASAPDLEAKLALAKQTGDESRHVQIQHGWMREFGTDPAPVITSEQEARIRAHFRELPWLEFLADLYLCVEALGSEAVEQVVPLADPGTRESLRIPLGDELDHVAFGVTRLKAELQRLDPETRAAFLARLPARIDALATTLHELVPGVEALFARVGADYADLCATLSQRREDLLQEVA